MERDFSFATPIPVVNQKAGESVVSKSCFFPRFSLRRVLMIDIWGVLFYCFYQMKLRPKEGRIHVHKN